MTTATLLVALLAAAPSGGDLRSQDHRSVRVTEFVDAFNARDLERMTTLVDDGFEWVFVRGHETAVETRGKTELRTSLAKYFESCPSCRSQIAWLRSVGDRVVALEVATWRVKDGIEARQSLSVYEFENDLLLRVFYFPSGPAPRPDAANRTGAGGAHPVRAEPSTRGPCDPLASPGGRP